MGGFADVMSVVRDVVATIAGLVAAAVAVLGLTTWRRQLRGNVQYEVARKLLFSAYKLRDAVENLRAPFIHAAETVFALKQTGASIEGLSDRDSLRVQKAAVYELRWRRVQDTRTALRINSLEARALWGGEAESAFRKINGCISKLWANITMDLEFETRGVEEKPEDVIARRKIISRIVDNPEEDEFMIDLDMAIDRIDALARPHLRS